MLDRIVANAPVFLLVAARVFALIMSLPLLSTRSAPRIAKVALTIYMAYFIFPQVSFVSGPYAAYASFISPQGSFNLDFIFLLIGEGLIGIIIGFYITIIFGAFSTAGQFFAFQMGFSASEVYDSLSQVENPLMGQYLNLVAMLVFLNNHWFQKLFLEGLVTSFQSLNAFSIINNTDRLLTFMLSALTKLFSNAMLIALPVMGTLFLINVCMGILSKAAPQMNMLSEGFPVLMLTAFFVITALLPQLCNLFTTSFNDAFKEISRLFVSLGQGGAQ